MKPSNLRLSRNAWMGSLVAGLLLAGGCGTWTEPLSNTAQYDKGLIVMYPGALVSDSEMSGFYTAIREAGIDQAIEVVQWTEPLSHLFDASGSYARNRESAEVEAQRLADYIRAHPQSPVTLLGYSAGSMYAIMVAEEMPQDAPLDKLIFLSSSVSSGYDLTAALDHTLDGAVAYWSAVEDTLQFIMNFLPTSDLTRDAVAALVGFASLDPRLTQFHWTPDMQMLYGQPGEHSFYLFNLEWIRDFIVPLVPTSRLKG